MIERLHPTRCKLKITFLLAEKTSGLDFIVHLLIYIPTHSRKVSFFFPTQKSNITRNVFIVFDASNEFLSSTFRIRKMPLELKRAQKKIKWSCCVRWQLFLIYNLFISVYTHPSPSIFKSITMSIISEPPLNNS